jgi:hypothetical protein
MLRSGERADHAVPETKAAVTFRMGAAKRVYTNKPCTLDALKEATRQEMANFLLQ